MGNSNEKSSTKTEKRASAADLESLRARKRFVLDCLDAVGVPVDEQDKVCSILLNAGITDEERLSACSPATFSTLGISESTGQLILNGRDKIRGRFAKKPIPKTSVPTPVVKQPTNRKSNAAMLGSSKLALNKFSKGDLVEHYRESDHLLRKGKVVGVHLDDVVNGVYYTVLLDAGAGREVQSAEKKLEFPGVWEKVLKERGIEPSFEDRPAASLHETDPINDDML